MAIEVTQNEEMSGGGKNEGRKGVGSAVTFLSYSLDSS